MPLVICCFGKTMNGATEHDLDIAISYNNYDLFKNNQHVSAIIWVNNQGVIEPFYNEYATRKLPQNTFH